MKHSGRIARFVVVPKRWIVERHRMVNRYRRLGKDCEALAFLRLVSIRLMLRKLCNPA